MVSSSWGLVVGIELILVNGKMIVKEISCITCMWRTQNRSERRAGELIPKQIREPQEGRPTKVSQDVTFPDIGISRMQSHRWQTIASIPEEKVERCSDKEIKGLIAGLK